MATTYTDADISSAKTKLLSLFEPAKTYSPTQLIKHCDFVEDRAEFFLHGTVSFNSSVYGHALLELMKDGTISASRSMPSGNWQYWLTDPVLIPASTGTPMPKVKPSAVSRMRPGTRTWDDGKRCAECCNGDRCDDRTHYDRTSKPGCPHCLNTGWALWTVAGREDYAKYRGTTIPENNGNTGFTYVQAAELPEHLARILGIPTVDIPMFDVTSSNGLRGLHNWLDAHGMACLTHVTIARIWEGDFGHPIEAIVEGEYPLYLVKLNAKE